MLFSTFLTLTLLAQEASTSKLLAEQLAPGGTRWTQPLSGPRQPPPPQNLERTEVPPPKVAADTQRLGAVPVQKGPRPHPLPEGLPLTYHQRDPAVPQVILLPIGPRVQVAARDVNEPLPLPRLAIRPVDSTPMDDPTSAASTAAALQASPPQRINPAPFVRLMLPDPFEHRGTLGFPRPDTDSQPPAPAPVRLPEYKR